MRILHVIHDFLPRHRAGSEIYAAALCRELSARHAVTVLCAEYDPGRDHGQVTWRIWDGLPVAEIVNNWVCSSFEDTYRAPFIADRVSQVMRAVRPDVVHVHNLLNLTFDLPEIARRHGSAVVATLHEFTLLCPSGGQRIHRSEEHVCHVIDPERCVRCYAESPFAAQVSWGRLAAVGARGTRARLSAVLRRFPVIRDAMTAGVQWANKTDVTADEIEGRLASAVRTLRDIDLVVSPSQFLANEFERIADTPSRIQVSDYGFAPLLRMPRARRTGPLHIGYVGTLAWHKGVHVLVEAVRGLPASACELTIFGDPDVFPPYTAHLRSLAAGLPVRFAGGVFDAQGTANAYAGINVLVVPSIWLENSPLVIHEAFMAGVPVVASDIGGIAELVEDGVTGLLFQPGSALALGAALRTLIDQPDRLTDLVTGVQRRPPVKSIDQDAREWEARYADVAGRRNPVLNA